MNIRIKLKEERAFLDVTFEIEKHNSKVNLASSRPGKSFVTYIVPDEWFESLHDFDQLRLTAFRV